MLIVCVQLHFKGRLQVVAGREHGCNASSHGGHMKIKNFYAKERKLFGITHMSTATLTPP
jgi:hypothetical protein